MRQAIAILLILFLLIGQGVGVAHVHSAAMSDDSAGHGDRPHIHVAGSRSHSHYETHVHATDSRTAGDAAETDVPGMQERREHDSDAIYASGVSAATHRKNLVDETGSLIPVAILTHSSTLGVPPAVEFATASLRRPPDDSGDCPLYLRILFIRC